jgi:TolB protein
VNSPALDVDPALSADGRVLVFASTRDDTTGTANLWITSRSTADGEWTSPAAVGPPINRDGHNEYGPCVIDNSRALLWHANRPGSHGSSDLWQSRRVIKPQP